MQSKQFVKKWIDVFKYLVTVCRNTAYTFTVVCLDLKDFKFLLCKVRFVKAIKPRQKVIL